MTRILVVEDNDQNRDMLGRRLARRGYEVSLAEDGAVALTLIRAEHPDLVLMDLSLPVVDGWEAIRRVRADPSTRRMPIIALTAHAMPADREQALAAGADDYDVKPIDLPRLLDKMRALLPRR
jgi:Response regulators consisting of a CheY-like receiver domain and a winged-helix DNA-binding domain